jgi:GNAT superfamily N-acetyltransferase
MGSLDDLYGPGTAEAFRAHMGSLTAVFPKVLSTVREQATTVEGEPAVAVEASWALSGAVVGFYRLVYCGPTVICTGLFIEPQFTGKGILTHLMAIMNQWWPTIGLTENLMTPTPGKPKEVLEECGFGPLPNGEWGTVLPSPKAEAFLANLKVQPPIF